jgi:hypothetical protein
VPASISMPSDEIVTVLAALPTVIWAKESKTLLPVKTSRLEAVALILPLVVVIRALPDVPASKEIPPVALAVILPLVLVVTAAPLVIVMALVLPPPAVPVSWIAPAAVLTEEPVMKMPSLIELPTAEPIPTNVIGALLVVVIEAAADMPKPWLLSVVPTAVPERLMPLPVAVVMIELEPVTRIPRHALVPGPPRHVPVIEPLVELILPPAKTIRPLQKLDAALLPPVPLTMILPETVVTAELLPSTTIPLLAVPPVADPVPFRVMPPLPVALIFEDERTPIPFASIPLPPPLPVTEMSPFAVWMSEFAPVRNTPYPAPVPLPPVPEQVMVAVPVVVTWPPERLIPLETVLLGPPVPLSVISLAAVLRIPTPVSEMPWLAPVVPVAVAVIEMGCEAPVVEKFTLEANPIPPLPLPVIDEVAVTVPAVVKAAATLMPLPPVVPLLPPTQFVNVTAPLLVKAAPKFTPWLVVPVPPVQVEKVTVPEVPVVIADVIETPWELAPLEPEVPLIVMGPLVLVILPAVIAVPM